VLEASPKEVTMWNELRSWSALLSRRSLLHSAIGAFSAVPILGIPPNAAIAALKISQKAVAYQDHPEGDKRCDKCAQFQSPNACKMVDGSINPQGYCRIFMPIRQSMMRPRNTPADAS
jgi:hypothetical protein